MREINYSKDAVVGLNTDWTPSSSHVLSKTNCSFFEAPERKEADQIFPPVGNQVKLINKLLNHQRVVEESWKIC